MRWLKKFRYRRALKLAAKRKGDLTADEQAAIKSAMSKNRIGLVIEYAEAAAQSGLCSALPTGVGEIGDGTILEKLVDWFVANWKEILEFIIGLFLAEQDDG